jgi:nitroreductase
MIFEKEIQEVIKERKSTRTYIRKQPDNSIILKIENYLNQLSTSNYEFVLVKSTNSNKKLGTYGFIKDATIFVISLLKKDFRDYEKFGYTFEKIILYVTSLGLSTCWLAGTFNKKQFADAVTLEDDFFIPIISPIGYSAEKEGFLKTLIRKQIGSDTRKPWENLFFEDTLDNPLKKDLETNYSNALEMVRLSPSASNKQPWRVIKNKNDYDFYPKRNENYSKFLKYDVQKNDIGIAMCHFELTLNEAGINGSWKNKSKSCESLEYISTWIQNLY